jgi:hypothetical protein
LEKNKLTATDEDFESKKRTKKEITDWHTATVAHKKYLWDRAKQDVTDYTAEIKASKATAVTFLASLKDGSYKFDGTNTIAAAQKTFFDSIVSVAGAAQIK